LTNDHAGALPLLQRAHGADKTNAEIAYHLSVALDGTGHRAEAKKVLSEALASSQNFEERSKAQALSRQWQ
jgi:Flp pilus assembly protein TadD